MLEASTTNADIRFDSTVINVSSSFTTIAGGNIIGGTFTASSFTATAGGNITGSTITANDITLTATGFIGISANPIAIARNSGNWTSDNLTLSAGSNIYLSTASAGALSSITASTQGTFSLNQTAGDINITSPINTAAATIMLEASATNADISFGTTEINASSFTATAGGNITGGTITAANITLSASSGSIGTEANRVRIRFRDFDDTATIFSATARDMNNNDNDTTTGNVYLSTNNGMWLNYVNEAERNRMDGEGTLSIILESVTKKQVKPGGPFSDLLDPILDLLGSGCEKDDILATVVSGFGVLCGISP